MSESDVVIRVEGLGKKYNLHHATSERYTALRDVVARQARAAGRLLNPFTLAGQLRKAQRQAAAERAESEEEFWALRDVSFEIRRGERVGIIGRNGAGKSTLLKILSRITEPTTGRVEIHGRVASLLEVGTGFHPELTGRENIYLNGAILGMTRREIHSKFDEIVDFAEVEKFLDTPVKRYSSGMYVRLAFAVAAHLEPEILVVDEVLAVGDANFQKKCLRKMEDSSQSGRTILFVSHQLDAITRLCPRSILIKSGSVASVDKTNRILDLYQDKVGANRFLNHCSGNGDYVLQSASVNGAKREPKSRFRFGEPIFIAMNWRTIAKISRYESNLLAVSIQILDSHGRTVTVCNTIGSRFSDCLPLCSSTMNMLCELENRLAPGVYTVTIGLWKHPYEGLAMYEDCLVFNVAEEAYSPKYTFTLSSKCSYAAKACWHLPI